MKLRTLFASLAVLLLGSGIAYAASRFQVVPREFDPARTFLVQAEWLDGIGCPTDARISPDGSTTTPYTDPACATGDTTDRRNQGLLLAKTGPTGNYASAVADIKGVKGPITELGYDIRKPGVSADPRGSHCGAGAPRFDITTEDGHSYFLGCNSPPAPVQMPGNGWLRLRWGGTVAGVATPVFAFSPAGVLVDITGQRIRSLQIVFDEGQDTGPDNFGLAVLDNIDVNGVLVGRGPNDGDKGERNGNDD